MRAGTATDTRTFSLGLQLLGFCVFVGISAGFGVAMFRGDAWWAVVGTGLGIAAGVLAVFLTGRGTPELPGR